MKRVVRRDLALIALCTSLAGCAGAAPWERGRLAKPQMAPDADRAQRALREHVHESREAGAGGRIGEGGGCGCD